MQVRRARIEEAQVIVDLQVDTIRRINSRDYSEEQINAWLRHRRVDHFEWLISHGHCYVCLDDREDNIVGMGTIRGNEVLQLFASADRQRQGIGSAILRQMEECALLQGFETVELDSSLSAVGFYERRGYEEIGRKQRDWGGNVTMTVVPMRKELNAGQHEGVSPSANSI
jgi:putative acetyltransferase